jgi:hypothetical protein
MMMLLVVLVIAVISLVAVAAGGVTANSGIAWFGIGASLFGFVLLIVDALRERERRDAETAAAEVVHFGTHYPDYAPSDRPPHDAPIHDDHEVDREVMREERVLHSDTGPRERDISGIRAAETIGDTHFRAAKDRGKPS